MASTTQQTHNLVDQEQPGYRPDENFRSYAVMNNAPLSENNKVPQGQKIVYGDTLKNAKLINNSKFYVDLQQLSNTQIEDQYSLTSIAAEYLEQQLMPSSINIPSPPAQQSMIHSNTDQQQRLTLSYEQPLPLITIPAQFSTPILVQNNRGRNAPSGAAQSNVQLRYQYPQITRVFYSSNTPNRGYRRVNQQRYEDVYSDRYIQNQTRQFSQNYPLEREMMNLNDNQQQPSMAACRYATSRFPFSPFLVIFSQEVDEYMVVDDLVKHALNSYNFELKTLGYRRGRAENNECRILIFVENSESFLFLYDQSNWPTTLAGCQFTTKSPSIPPQLALILPSVPFKIDWDKFVQELKEKYPGISNIIRLKNRAQQPLRRVKLEFLSSKLRNEILEDGGISVMYMKFDVVEYYPQPKVLICTNCYGIGHFRSNCRQKGESTCKTCGEKYPNFQGHQCSGVPQCIHCGGPHVSNDLKCKVVKDYRAALTRYFISNGASVNVKDTISRPVTPMVPLPSSQSYSIQRWNRYWMSAGRVPHSLTYHNGTDIDHQRSRSVPSLRYNE